MRASRIGVAAAAGITVGIAIAFLWNPTAPEPAPEREQGPYSLRSLEAGGSPPLGDADAPLTMIEWGDYQCTFCYRFHQNTLDAIKKEYVDEGLLRIVFRDFPLNGPDSVLAAQASRCAEDQNMFWPYHDALYENWGGERTGWVTRAALYGFALNAGLDTSEFTECMDSGMHVDRIAAEYRDSQGVGIDATPSFIVHDGERAMRIVGSQPYSTFKSVFDNLLE